MPKKYRKLFYIEDDALYVHKKLKPKDKKEALKMSVTKWEIIAEQPHIFSGGDETCALCVLFICNNCEGCPVDKKTKSGCGSSPFSDWCNNKTRATALAEVKFLKSLRKGLK